MSSSPDFAKAKACAFRLIKFRLRSEYEMREKLASKSFAPETIGRVVDFLTKTGFLDDALFARLWVDSRIKKPLGPKRLRYELKKKGIKESLIEDTLAEALRQYSQEDAIRDIISRKLKAMGSLDWAKIKARLYGLLLRRGYPQDKVMEALGKLGKIYEKADDEPAA